MASSKYRSNTFIKTEPTVEVNREPEPILSPNPWIYTKKWCRRCPPTKLMHNKINTAVPLSSRLVPEFKSPSPCKERLALRAPFRSISTVDVSRTVSNIEIHKNIFTEPVIIVAESKDRVQSLSASNSFIHHSLEPRPTLSRTIVHLFFSLINVDTPQTQFLAWTRLLSMV